MRGSRPRVGAPEIGTIEELQEDASHGVVRQRLSGNRYEESTICGGQRPPGDQISVERQPSCCVKWQQPALLELGLSDDEPISSYIVDPQRQSFRDPHAGSGEQAEEGYIHGRSDRAYRPECPPQREAIVRSRPHYRYKTVAA